MRNANVGTVRDCCGYNHIANCETNKNNQIMDLVLHCLQDLALFWKIMKFVIMGLQQFNELDKTSISSSISCSPLLQVCHHGDTGDMPRSLHNGV